MSTRRPPAPDNPPVLRETVPFMTDPLETACAVREECGPVARLSALGLGEFYTVASPDGFEQVLVEDRDAFRKSEGFRLQFGESVLSTEGEQWEHQREALEEFFYPAKIRSYVDRMVELTERRVDRWTAGERLALHREMSDAALENFFGTVFDRPLDPDGDATLRRAASDLNLCFKPTSFVLPNWVPTPARRRFFDAVETLEDEARRLLRERERAHERDEAGEDLLSTLVERREDRDADLSDREIVDQVLALTFAGHDTTALLLTYALHQLGRHDAVRDRFYDELDAVLGGDRPTLSDVRELAVTRRVIDETLRAFPPIHTVPRETTRAVTVDGYRLAPDTRTHLSVWALHRDPRHWAAPDEWRPARWRDTSPGEAGFAFAPFGAGPRACLGRRFARLEATLVLATVGRRYRLDPAGGLSLDPMSTLQPADGVPVTVRER